MHLGQDVRYATRSLRKAPAFTLSAIATLALAIAANAVTFALVKVVLINPLPYGDPDRLVTVVESDSHTLHADTISAATFAALRQESDSFDQVALYGDASLRVTDSMRPEMIRGMRVSVARAVGAIGRLRSGHRTSTHAEGVTMRELWRQAEKLFRRRSFERDLDEELQFHLDMKIRNSGDRVVTERALGSSFLLRERAEDAWGSRWLDDALWDVRFALRQFRQNPGFTAAAVLTLALGIGINSTVFTVTNTLLFKGFPHVDPGNRILYIATPGGESLPDVEDWRTLATSFADLAAVSSGGLRVRLRDQLSTPEVYDGTQLSANAFRVLEQKPILGRDFASADERPGAAPVTILSYGLWERRYSKDPAIIGHTVWIDEHPTTVIGVMAAGFDFPHHRVDLWLPLTLTPNLTQRQTRVLWFAFGRLAGDATFTGARQELDEIGRRLETAYPLTNRGVRPRVMNFHQFFLGPNAATIYGSMWAAVGFVLLIACANLANLLLARAVSRSREIAIRIALGAGRGRVIRQFLIESVTLSIVGGALGWLMTRWCVRAYELVAEPPGGYNHWTYAMDYRVFAYVVAISIGTGLLFGLAPASRLSSLDINTTIKDGGRGAAGGRQGRHASSVLVIAETALAVVLLAGAGVMIRTFLNMYTADLGLNTAGILTASVRLPPDRYPGVEGQLAFFERLITRLGAIPGVESVALANNLPGLYAPRLPYELAGATPVDEARRPAVAAVVISPTYFRTVGAHLLAGRAFRDVDEGAGFPVAMVNQRFAGTIWPGEDPVGKRLRLFEGKTPDAWRTVVGVVSNIVQNDPTGQTFDPLVYVPLQQKPARTMAVIARAGVPPGSLTMSVRRAIQALDSDLVIGSGLGSVEGPKTLAESLAFNYWSNGLNGMLFLIFAAMAVLLASMGLYAVVAHSVTERTQEIGLRIALGATARDVLSLVLTNAMRPVGLGVALGLTASLGVTPLLKSQLVRVSTIDPLTLSVATTILVAAAIVGCMVPAWRAMHVDPVVALRHD